MVSTGSAPCSTRPSRAGDLKAEADPAALAELVVTTVHAMQVRAVILPDNTSPGVQRGVDRTNPAALDVARVAPSGSNGLRTW